jgi:hypothetical protein
LGFDRRRIKNSAIESFWRSFLFNGINFDKSRTANLDSLAIGIFILIETAITDPVFAGNLFIALLSFFIGVILRNHPYFTSSPNKTIILFRHKAVFSLEFLKPRIGQNNRGCYEHEYRSFRSGYPDNPGFIFNWRALFFEVPRVGWRRGCAIRSLMGLGGTAGVLFVVRVPRLEHKGERLKKTRKWSGLFNQSGRKFRPGSE